MNATTEGAFAKPFRRLGWLGFWMQAGRPRDIRRTDPLRFGIRSTGGLWNARPACFIEYLSIAGLLLLAFATVWFFRYTRLAAWIAGPKARPAPQEIQRVAWIGVVATMTNVVFSLIVILFEVVQLFLFFSAPLKPAFGGNPDGDFQPLAVISRIKRLAAS